MSTEETNAKVEAALAAASVTLSFEFVPLSKSRNAATADKQPTINWRVTLSRPGRSWSTDYSQGYGHLPWPPRGEYRLSQTCIMGWRMIQDSCEHGRAPGFGAGKLAPPTAAEVMYALTMDARAIDCGCFEDWANECGYDTDSRSAEATYKACLETALQLRAILGPAAMLNIADLLTDY